MGQGEQKKSQIWRALNYPKFQIFDCEMIKYILKGK